MSTAPTDLAQAVTRSAPSGLPRRLGWLLAYAAVTAGGLVYIFPVLLMLRTSLTPVGLLYADPPVIVPWPPHWANYAEMWQGGPVLAWLRNSLLVTGVSVVAETISSTLVAYGFARFRFPYRDQVFLLVISTILLPREVVLIPTFLLFKALGWLDTLLPLIVPSFFGGGAFFIFLLRQFFMTIPRELDEAAKIDGANSVQILIRILLPLSLPALATVAIFSFLAHWNDFLEPLIFLNKPELFTVALGLRYFQTLPNEAQEPREQLLMAASLVTTLPILILFFSAQRYFVQGIVMTGVKG